METFSFAICHKTPSCLRQNKAPRATDAGAPIPIPELVFPSDWTVRESCRAGQSLEMLSRNREHEDRMLQLISRRYA